MVEVYPGPSLSICSYRSPSPGWMVVVAVVAAASVFFMLENVMSKTISEGHWQQPEQR